jgi:hypothetical protein
MIISLHIPKTAGSSFGLSLKKHFGRKVFFDYDDMHSLQKYFVGEDVYQNLMHTILVTKEKCIHGHFLLDKWINKFNPSEHTYITWLRDPVERLISEYYYYQRYYDPSTAGKAWRRVIEENWSLERFCLSNEFQNIQSLLIGKIPIEQFKFIGITENYEEDFQYFSKTFLGVDAEPYYENINKIKQINIDSGLRRDIEEFHSVDVNLYKTALIHFK